MSIDVLEMRTNIFFMITDCERSTYKSLIFSYEKVLMMITANDDEVRLSFLVNISREIMKLLMTIDF